ncbi:hypothetical protein M1403_04085 [Patescibacteria group bacterium]|nr:hypothetical protein [Patescibacteria group bacterium]
MNKLLIPAVVALIVLAVGGGYLFISKTSKLPAALSGLQVVSVIPRISEKDLVPYVSDANVRKNMVAQANQSAYRVTSTSSGKGTTSVIDIQLVGNDFRIHTAETDNGKPLSESISIGDTTYIKDPSDGKWWKQTAKPDSQQPTELNPQDFMPDNMVKEATASAGKMNFKFLGMEACGNLNCFKYEESFADTPGATTVWFDDKQYLTRKMVSGSGESSFTQEYSYGNISVNPPSPTKDVPEGKSIYEMLYQQGQSVSGSLPAGISY